MTNTPSQPSSDQEQTASSDLGEVRREKLSILLENGFSYPNNFKVTHRSSAIREWLEANPNASEPGPRFALAGRIVQKRVMGKASFVHVLDREGKFQVYVRRDDVGELAYNQFKSLDLGDLIGIEGEPFTTKTGEPSLHARQIVILNKCLHPLPEKFHGLSDIESRYRHRYVDLIANPEVREIFRKRSIIISEVRNYLLENDFLEVETPILQYTSGGAAARPFKTHYNALSADMVLRIALELPLKKLIVGGLERVFEIGRNFRNEGLSKKHNPEFSMLEFYEAYATFEDLMIRSEEIFCRIAKRLYGSLIIPFGDKQIDLTPPWPRIRMQDSLYEIAGVSRSYPVDTLDGLRAIAKEYEIKLNSHDWGECLDELWGELVEPKITNPVFITHHPLSISPLARKHQENPLITDRFEIIIAGMEMGNAFSELNDAIDQRERLEEQSRQKAAGNELANDVDEDFLFALEHGMPPTAGQGIGIDTEQCQ